jgi:hypothetical protein
MYSAKMTEYFVCKTPTALFRMLSSLSVQVSCVQNLPVLYFMDMPLSECGMGYSEMRLGK